jgi:DNA-binding CsgD family transcriptional regulator
VFDAPLSEAGWDGLACELASTFAAASCCLQIRDSVTGLVRILGKTSNLDDELLADYTTWYFKDDVWTTRALPTFLNQPVTGDELISDEELVATDFYQDFCKPLNLFRALCGAQDVGDHCIGFVKLYRPKEGESFDQDDKRHLGLLLPHMRNALLLGNRVQTMASGQAITVGALEQLSLGVIIVGAGGVVRFHNKTVQKMLRADLGVAIRRGRLCLDDLNAEQMLYKALNEVLEASARQVNRIQGTMITARSKSDRPLSLLVSPLASDAQGAGHPVAAIFVGDPQERRKPREESISKAYGLTPAEARLVRSLLDGEHLQEYAGRIGVSLHTVKTQLKQVFLKTGHGRQTDLVRDILSNPVLRMRP